MPTCYTFSNDPSPTVLKYFVLLPDVSVDSHWYAILQSWRVFVFKCRSDWCPGSWNHGACGHTKPEFRYAFLSCLSYNYPRKPQCITYNLAQDQCLIWNYLLILKISTSAKVMLNPPMTFFCNMMCTIYGCSRIYSMLSNPRASFRVLNEWKRLTPSMLSISTAAGVFAWLCCEHV